MKRRLLTILVGIILFLLPGCSNGDIADQIVKENIDNLYLVVYGQEAMEDYDIENLAVTYNKTEEKYSSRSYKIILLTEKYAENISAERITNFKNLMSGDGYWILFPCKEIEKVKGFAACFGKAVTVSEHTVLRGYCLHYNKTQAAIQGVPHYVTSNSEDKKERNRMIKNSFRDMIENRYEDLP